MALDQVKANSSAFNKLDLLLREMSIAADAIASISPPQLPPPSPPTKVLQPHSQSLPPLSATEGTVSITGADGKEASDPEENYGRPAAPPPLEGQWREPLRVGDNISYSSGVFGAGDPRGVCENMVVNIKPSEDCPLGLLNQTEVRHRHRRWSMRCRSCVRCE